MISSPARPKDSVTEARSRQSHWRDGVVLGLIFATALGLTLLASRQLHPQILHYSTFDFWFESDPPAFLDQMQSPEHDHHFRTRRHPLWSLVMYPPVRIVRHGLGVTVPDAMRIVTAGTAAAWAALVFLTLRLAGLRRTDAVVFTILASASAGAIFWMPVPETYTAGALSIVAAVFVAALSARGRHVPIWACVTVSTATLAITTPNWSIGLLMLAIVLPWRRAVLAGLATLAVTYLLWRVQKHYFPAAELPLEVWIPTETKYLLSADSSGLLAKLSAFFAHAIVAPDISDAYGFRLSVQGVLPGYGSWLAAVGIALWATLLVGSATVVVRWTSSPLVRLLLLSLAAQLGISLLFGIETFLYSAHWAPLLVMTCAFAATTPARRWAVPLAAALAIVAGVNNVSAFRSAATRLAVSYEHERQFTAKVAALTDPGQEDLILCGRHAAAALGEPRAPAGSSPATADIENIGRHVPTDACYFTINALPVTRRGWVISYEDWNLETVEAFRKRGARYFVTPYEYGLGHGAGFLSEMGARFRTIERSDRWAFYDLSQAAGSASTR